MLVLRFLNPKPFLSHLSPLASLNPSTTPEPLAPPFLFFPPSVPPSLSVSLTVTVQPNPESYPPMVPNPYYLTHRSRASTYTWKTEFGGPLGLGLGA